jgi:hypothetical protein
MMDRKAFEKLGNTSTGMQHDLMWLSPSIDLKWQKRNGLRLECCDRVLMGILLRVRV